MKKLFSLLLLIAATGAGAQTVTFFTGSWADAQAQAKAQQKFIFVDCYTDWCSWCKVMDKKTFPDSALSAFMNQHFFAVKKEMEHDEGITLNMKYQVPGYPTYLVFSPEGDLVYRTSGYQPPADFLATLRKAIDPSTQMSFKGLSKNLDPGYPEFYKQSFSGKRTDWPKQAEVIAYLDKQADKLSETSWAVMARFELNDAYNEWILQHREELGRSYGTDAVDDKVMGILRARLRKAADAKDEKQLATVLGLVDKYLGTGNDALKLSFKLGFYEKTVNWKGYVATYQAAADAGQGSNVECNEVSWKLYEHCDDQNLLRQAAGWMKAVCDKEPLYMYLDTYAALLYKSKQYTEARTVAEKAISTGTASGEDVKSTQDLLEQIKAKGF